MWSPFYAVADLVTRVQGGPPDGFSRPYVAAVAYGSAFYGFVAILLSIGAARRLAGRGLLAGVLVWLGTPLLFYMYVSPPYSHACSAFAVALFVTIWLHARERWTVGGAIALGLSGALMAMVREQDAFLALGPAVDFVWTAFGRAGLRAEEAGSGIGSARGPSAARSRRARASRDGAPGALINADLVAPALAGCLSFAIGLLPVSQGHFSSPQLAASPLPLGCFRSFSPTRRSTVGLGRRGS